MNNMIKKYNVCPIENEELLKAIDEVNSIKDVLDDIQSKYNKAKRKCDKLWEKHINRCSAKAEYREKTEYEASNNSLYIEVTEVKCLDTTLKITDSGKKIPIIRQFEVHGRVIPEYIDKWQRERELPWQDERTVVLYFDCREQFAKNSKGEMKMYYKKDYYYLKSMLKDQKITKGSLTFTDALQRIIGSKIMVSYKYVTYDSSYEN